MKSISKNVVNHSSKVSFSDIMERFIDSKVTTAVRQFANKTTSSVQFGKMYGAEEYSCKPIRSNPFYPYNYMEVALYAKSLTRTELQKYGYDDLDEFLEELALLYSLKEEDQNSATFKCEDLNQFISAFRKLYYSGRKKSFRQFLSDVEELTDILD